MNIKLGKGNLLKRGENCLYTHFKKIRSTSKMCMNKISFMCNMTASDVWCQNNVKLGYRSIYKMYMNFQGFMFKNLPRMREVISCVKIM